MGKFKRKKVNCTVHGVDIFNVSPDQSKKLKEFLSKLNAELITRLGDEATKCIDDKVELSDEMLRYAKMDALAHQVSRLESKKKEWILEFTSIDEIDDEDIADPNEELKNIISKINKVCIKPEVDALQPIFEMMYKQFLDEFNKKYDLEVGE